MASLNKELLDNNDQYQDFKIVKEKKIGIYIGADGSPCQIYSFQITCRYTLTNLAVLVMQKKLNTREIKYFIDDVKN